MAIIVARSIAAAGGTGYACIDERAAGGKLREADIWTCPHCEAVIFVKEWKEDGAFCGRCNKPICAHCGDRMQTHGCEPFMKKIEELLESRYRRMQNAKVLGT